jgi:hypothetical protein
MDLFAHLITRSNVFCKKVSICWHVLSLAVWKPSAQLPVKTKQNKKLLDLFACGVTRPANEARKALVFSAQMQELLHPFSACLSLPPSATGRERFQTQ